jgi:peptidoglycan/LPS O-acetylase OafA/YrhL
MSIVQVKKIRAAWTETLMRRIFAQGMPETGTVRNWKTVHFEVCGGAMDCRYHADMATSLGKPKILPLTSARFFAALYVMLYHTFPRAPASNAIRGWMFKVVSFGYISVSFFFMLSGFILAIVYLRENRALDKRRFFIARFARIYPLYIAAMLLDTPHFLYTQLHLLHGNPWKMAGVFMATTGLVQAWLNMCSLNPPGWSLSTEVFFYVLFPFLGVALWKMRGRLALVLSVLIYSAGLSLVLVLERSWSVDKLSFHPFPHLFVFVLGILLAKLFVWIEESQDRSQRLMAAAPGLLCVCAIGILALPVFTSGLDQFLVHGSLAPLFAVAILAFASGNWLISRIFSARWLVVLGEASYGLYLLHYPIYSILRRPIERFGMPMMVVYLVGTISLSVVSYYWLEVPARHWILAKEKVRSMETLVTSSLSQ